MKDVRSLLERATSHIHMLKAVAESYGELDSQWQRSSGDYFHLNVVAPLEELKAALSSLDWTPVGERLPQIAEPVQVDVGDNCVHVGHLNSDLRWVEWVPAYSAQPIQSLDVKRWRTIPTPPLTPTEEKPL